MTDLEIARACAEAMGYEFNPHRQEAKWENTSYIFHGSELLRGGPTRARRRWKYYDPLHDDAQAMALVKRFVIHLFHESGGVWCVWPSGADRKQCCGPDLNRAICECVAKMKGGS